MEIKERKSLTDKGKKKDIYVKTEKRIGVCCWAGVVGR